MTKFERSNEFTFSQFANIYDISVTLLVSNFDKSKLFTLVQSLNIKDISFALLVTNFDTSKETKALHP